jgi:hypothetical protein
MERIEDSGVLLAIVVRDRDWRPGLSFCTPDDLFVQVGLWRYPAGKDLANHRHKPHRRAVERTQEMVYVKRGRMKARLFAADGRPVREVVLEAGDLAVLVQGGHGYQILDDDTQVLEVKNGPFLDAASDKEAL